ncbi:Peptidase C45 acyl-coenzyme A:6-aminopenicillanic acid acyl-transferase OS=Deinococcus maricopensis (strain DSM 21211 / LMG 22137 / NRRL B-23946 / LB-34) GN=Deima_2897 PE=4 SV=1: AAT [Gemmata massiliana]|uniref:Peptidase C45 hydrolase domain-containing protein n=1 Tax=Gemmata massiliana TaxID=1210884 RepID=A0A6P2D818_9BACT|nr:C45 family peptidase [Gemmata massiliana]VTR95610.1 Peptidase C45 acyl-coenzyme A:6-aminopenicillanic acid acyl-transferase OS=Deinococcus maricopensis (strain DSM 21211 / LMG 22137 / NRRL B-23946 / LB-34) GN=Deima_2897 PE=4 SV=1: AAT [Gemmata massiliana]
MQITNSEGYSYEPVRAVGHAPPYPADLVAKSKELLTATCGLFKRLGPVAHVVPHVFAKYKVHAERARTGAAVIGVEPVDLLAANLCYDLLMGASAMGCSTLALAGPDGPVLARNMDWFPAEKVAKASCLVTEEYGVNAGFLGMLGAVTGLSRHGFCVCLNAAFGGSDPDGYPMLLFLRHVLDTATNYRTALEMVTTERLMSGGIVTVVGTRNEERAIVERAPRRATVREARGSEPLLATNHFRDLNAPEECPRYAHMAAFVGQVRPLDLLTGKHVLQEITAQHVVMCPATQTTEMFVPSHLLPEIVCEEMTLADLYRYFLN